jgi:hypothetical protein
MLAPMLRLSRAKSSVLFIWIFLPPLALYQAYNAGVFYEEASQPVMVEHLPRAHREACTVAAEPAISIPLSALSHFIGDCESELFAAPAIRNRKSPEIVQLLCNPACATKTRADAHTCSNVSRYRSQHIALQPPSAVSTSPVAL